MAEPNSPRIDQASHMPTRADFEKLAFTTAEAIALCEAAQENFVRINDELQRTIAEGRSPPMLALLEEARAQRRLFDARVRLSQRLSERQETKKIARSQPELDTPPSNVRQLQR